MSKHDKITPEVEALAECLLKSLQSIPITGQSDREICLHFAAGVLNRKEAAPEMYEALMDVQWANGGFCPQCAQGPVKGHQPKCLIGVALKKAVQA